MKKIFVIVIMILSSLSWGLTFKNGKLIEDADQITKTQKEENYKKLHQSEYQKLSFNEKLDYLKITLSGNYIDKTLKNKIGKYVLPSSNWFRKYINGDVSVFYKNGSRYGDMNGDGKLDYIGFGVGHSCGTGTTEGSFEVIEGRRGCAQNRSQKFPVLIFSIDSQFNFIKEKALFNFKGADKYGYPNPAGLIIDDFNNDGINDFFVPDTRVTITNDDFSYKSDNLTFLSNDYMNWEKVDHRGYYVSKEFKNYNGFSANTDTGDIDNDGDIDIITSEFQKGTTCHFNDGNGIFTSKLCNNVQSHNVTVGDFNNDGYLDMVVGHHDHYNPEYTKYSPTKWMDKNQQKIVLMYGNGKGKFSFKQQLEPFKIGNFIFSTVPHTESFDFDNDGDLDVIMSVAGPFYSGSALIIYENIDGQLHLGDTNIVLEPLPEWQDPKIWGSVIKDEYSHEWVTYCGRVIFIDINSDNLMDVMCSNTVQDRRSDNHFLINKGNLQFDFFKPEEVTKWVTWLENAIVAEEDIKGPDGEDILKDLEILIQ
jgi:hypothetical protein